MYAPVIGPNGVVYVTTNDDYLYALNPNDGSVLWSYARGGLVPAVDSDGAVYAAGHSNGLQAVDKVLNGTLQWRYAFGPYGDVGIPTVTGETLYVGYSYNRSIYAINTVDGSLRWSYRVGDVNQRFTAPAVGPDGTLYVGSTAGVLYAFDSANGTLRWQYRTGGTLSRWTAPVVGPDNTVYVGASDGKVYAINGADGTLRWQYTTGGRIMAGAALGADGTLYVGSEDGYIYALNTRDGTLRWRYWTGGLGNCALAVDARGTVYVARHNQRDGAGYVYALVGENGTPEWRYGIGMYAGCTALAVGPDDTVYVTSANDKRIYSLHAIGNASEAPHLTPTGHVSTVRALRILAHGPYAYVSSREQGLSLLNIHEMTPTVESTLPLSWTVRAKFRFPYAYVADGDGGLRIVDISDVKNPRIVGTYDTPGRALGIDIGGHHTYVADTTGGLRVIDVSDPTQPIEVGHVSISGKAYDVSVVWPYAFLVDWDHGLRVIDISNPTSPREVGSTPPLGSPTAIAIQGHYAYIVSWTNRTLHVVDISDPTHPAEVSALALSSAWEAVYDVTLNGSHAYVAAEQAGVVIVDVSNPSQPVEIGRYDTPGYAAGVDVDGRYLYVADWLNGLLILRLEYR